MFMLIKKELTANVRYMLLSIAVFILYLFIFSANGPAIFMMCLVFTFYALSTTNLVLDERYKIELLLSTLPIRRRDIVLSKYALIVVIFIGCFILYTLLFFITTSLGYYKIPPLTLVSASIGFLILSLFNGIMLPLAYKFSAQATRYVTFILFFAVFFFSNFLGSINLTSFTGFLNSLSETQFSLLLILIAIILNIISYTISISVLSKKDF